MNILFLIKSLGLGGLEIVTSTLANKFSEEGHRVCVYAFEKRSGLLCDLFVENVKVFIAGKYHVSYENVNLLREVLIDHHIQVVINQWGLPLIPIRTICKAKKGLDVKVISVYHNDPLKNGRLQNVENEIQNSKKTISKFIFCLKKITYRCITGLSMRYNYNHCDLFEVLSPNYIRHFQQFIWMNSTPKLKVLTNPLTIDNKDFIYVREYKRNEVLYVGRMDYTQKRIDRIIDVWSHIEFIIPDWQLTIVGGGNEQKNMKNMVDNLNLKHVYFEDFQNPRPYYERASILILTSEFEGFPLVLAECMSFGVVPVVYGSFSAVYDIIENGKDGIIIPKTSAGFNVALMSEKVKALVFDKPRLNQMALSAIEKSKKYSLDKIYQQWIEVMQ